MIFRTINDLQPVLRDASLGGQTVVYTVGPRPDGVIGDVTTMYPVMLGQEFPKTYGHYHSPAHSETYIVKSGWALVLIQKIDEAGRLLDFQHRELKAGESFTVPAGYGHVLINTGSDVLVTWDDWDPRWAEHVYEPVTAKRGFAYYIVRGQNGQPQLIQNPAYFPERKKPRLPNYDYSQGGWYFVTICAEEKQSLFGEIKNDVFVPSNVGNMINYWWQEIPKHFAKIVSLDVFQLMPTHFHGIVCIDDYFVGGDRCVAPSISVPIAGGHAGPPLRSGQGLFRIVQWFKTMSTNEYLRFIKLDGGRTHGFAPTAGLPRQKLWQRNYYEHVIRNEKDLARIREYIVNNPLEWGSDEENPNRSVVGVDPCVDPSK